MLYLPYDADANDNPPRKEPRLTHTVALAAPVFPYVRKALTPDAFTAYVESYDFGSIPPSYLVVHHTAIPDASWAPLPGQPADRQWDYGEQGMSAAQIADKRLRQLDGIKNYYQFTLGWDAGPHLFVDDRFVYLMTPMYDVGIHAAQGNSTLVGGRLAYSIGMEVVGCYTTVRWPPAIQANVRHVVQTLQRRLGTFQLQYRAGPGFVAGHRAYNKPSCPGDAITNDFIIQTITAAESTPAPQPTPAPSDDGLPRPLPYIGVAAPSITAETFRAVLRDHQSPVQSFEANYLYDRCVALNIDPAVFLGHWHAEDANWQCQSAGGVYCNPLNIKARQDMPASGGWLDFTGGTNGGGGFWLGLDFTLLWLKWRYGAQELTTVEQIAPVWVYGPAGGDASVYIQKLRATVAAIRRREVA